MLQFMLSYRTGNQAFARGRWLRLLLRRYMAEPEITVSELTVHQTSVSSLHIPGEHCILGGRIAFLSVFIHENFGLVLGMCIHRKIITHSET